MLSCDKNQVLNVPDDFDCNCQESSYCVPVEQADETPIKLSLTDISGNIITNGNFSSASGWTVGADWSISGGKATATYSGSGVNLSRPADITIVPGYYMVQFDLISDAMNLGLKVFIGGELIPGPLVGTLAGTHIGTHTYRFFKYVDAPSDNLLKFEVLVGDFSIDNVVLNQLSAVQFEIKDCNTDTVYHTETNNASVSYFETGALALTIADPKENSTDLGYAIVTFDWSAYNLADGCYCICFKDAGIIGFEFIRNGTFADTSNWTIVNSGAVGWVITGGKIVRNEAETGGEVDTFEQTLAVPLSDSCYLLTFDIEAPSNWSFTIYYDTATTSDNVLANIAGTGNDSAEISIEAAITSIKFSATGAFDSSIDNISIMQDPECYECVTTQCISLRSAWTAPNMCNMLITGTNTNAAFGFPAGYSFKGRVFGMIRNGVGREVTTDIYKDLSGLKSLQYADREKVKELQIFQVPQYVHDWLELALSSQTLTIEINGQSKTFIKLPGDYTPNWRKRSPDAPVIVEIQEAQQLPANARNT